MKYTDGQLQDMIPPVLDLDLRNDVGVFNSRSYGLSIRQVWYPNKDDVPVPTKKGFLIGDDPYVFLEEIASAINDLEFYEGKIVVEIETRE